MNQKVLIERIQNSPVDSNCYLIRNFETKFCILVDPALGNGDILYEYLIKKGLKLEYVILTHEHFDHISSVELLRNIFDCKVIATKECSEHIGHPKKNLSLFRDHIGFICAPADIIIDENTYLQLAGILVKFYITPGHSEGSLCLSIGNNLFTGDTILKGYTTVVKLPGGSKRKLRQSIEKIFSNFDSHTTVHPGHGQAFQLSEVSIFSIVSEV